MFGGLGCLGVVQIVLLVLKITNVIAWSWWWVLAPLWLPTVLGVTFIGCGFILAAFGIHMSNKA